MKFRKQSTGFFPVLVIVSLLMQQCNRGNDDPHHTLVEFADQIKVINTHEHQHWPEEFGDLHFRIFHLLQVAYLGADIVSAGGTGMDLSRVDTLDLDEWWAINGTALDFTRATSYYSHLIRGFQKLYDFDDLYLTEQNTGPLSEQIEHKYQDYRSWFDDAFREAGFEIMLLDQYWKPFNTEIDREHYALVFHINPLVMQASSKPAAGEDLPEIFMRAEEEGYSMGTLEEYLAYCEHLFQKNVESRAVCVKNSLAYSRTLYFEDVPYDVAMELYAMPSREMSPGEKKKIQDFMFHWIIQRSVVYDLPVQIHTGYLAGNGNVLDNGQPVKLNNLFLEYPDARFVLFHGGYPWTGEYAAFGKMFPNVYLDLVWLPQISREEAVHALDEMLDGVPYDKFFWGGDCGLIEESTGSLEFGKDVVVEVLSRRIGRGLLTEEVAMDILQHVFRENALELFQLEKRLERSF